MARFGGDGAARWRYGTVPAGLVGNDDVGPMSACLVFAMLGFYPAEPFSGHYLLGSPMLSRAVLQRFTAP